MMTNSVIPIANAPMANIQIATGYFISSPPSYLLSMTLYITNFVIKLHESDYTKNEVLTSTPLLNFFL